MESQDFGKYATTERDLGGITKVTDALSSVVSTTKGVYDGASQAVILTLSKAWIGLGVLKPARTESPKMDILAERGRVSSASPTINRYDYKELYSVQIGDYFLPVSQTFRLRASKHTNVSMLVDGPDIIQQTRKEAKTIDCTLRISLRDNQPNLQFAKENRSQPIANGFDSAPNTEIASITTLAKFLQDFYENDAILQIRNSMINDTFGVTHVFISKYDFIPKTGMGTYSFEFSLTEVKYGENVLTFNLRGINDDKK